MTEAEFFIRGVLDVLVVVFTLVIVFNLGGGGHGPLAGA
jgi:hypothetical protein